MYCSNQCSVDVQDLAPSRPSVSRPGKGSEASASGAPQEHPEDELVLITQKMFREDMPHIDFDVLRQLLEESPNPLLPPPAPVFVGQPRSAQSVSSSSASLTADTLFAAEPATPAVYPVPLHNPTLAMAEGHYNELMSDDSQSQVRRKREKVIEKFVNYLAGSSQHMVCGPLVVQGATLGPRMTGDGA